MTKISKNDEKRVNEILNQLYGGEVSMLPREIYNLSVNELESLYNYAYKMFQSGKFKEALPLFQFGYDMDPFSYKNIFAIAACQHHMKEYDLAIDNYMESLRIEPFNPTPLFHMFDCYVQKNDLISAQVLLAEAIQTAEGQPEFEGLKQKAELELDRVIKEQELKSNIKVSQ